MRQVLLGLLVGLFFGAARISLAAPSSAYLRADHVCTMTASDGRSTTDYSLTTATTANDGGDWYGTSRLFVSEGLKLTSSVTGYSTAWYSYAREVSMREEGPSAAKQLLGSGATLSVSSVWNKLYGTSSAGGVGLFYAVFTPIAYSVTYDLASGTPGISQPTSAIYDQPFVVSAPTRTGYVFAGWTANGRTFFNGENSDVSVSNLTTVAGSSVKLTATWTPRRYPLNLNLAPGVTRIFYRIGSDEGWSSVSSSTMLEVDFDAKWSAYVELAYGYTLSGVGSNVDNPVIATMTTAGAVFEPHPSKLTYRVTVTSNPSEGGTTKGGATYEYGDDATLEATAQTGWYFVQWSDGSRNNPHVITVACKTNLWANFQRHVYRVTFVFRDSTGSEVQEIQSVAYGDAAAAPTSDKYNCYPGHHFDKWDSNGWGTITGDTLVNAVYAADTYTVHFNGNGATDGSVGDQVLTYGVEQALALNRYSRTGYRFVGWCTDSSGVGTSYDDEQRVRNIVKAADGTLLSQGAELTLYAQWEPISYTIHFEPNGAAGEMDDVTVKYDQPVSLPECTFDNGVQQLVCWSASDGRSYTNQEMVVRLASSAAIVTMKAQWTTVGTVTYHGNPGKTAAAESDYRQSFDKNREFVLLPNAFVRIGYTFAGWTNEVGQVYREQELVTHSDDLDLYAVWSPIIYDVQFDANGGTGSMASRKLTYDVGVVIEPSTLTRPADGYFFDGWGTNATEVLFAPDQPVKNLSSVNGDHTRLYAIWKLDVGKWSHALNCSNLKFTPIPDMETVWSTNCCVGGLTNGIYKDATAKLSASITTLGKLSFTWLPSAIGKEGGWSGKTQDQRREATKLELFADDTRVCLITGIKGSITTNITIASGVKKITFAHNPNGGANPGILSNVTWIPEVTPPTSYRVSFDKGEHGSRVAGGEVMQLVVSGGAALEPTVRADPGWVFTGWDSRAFTNVTAVLSVKAQYMRAEYRIIYADCRGADNPNPLTFVSTNECAFAPLVKSGFREWSPSALELGTTSNLVVTALWNTTKVPEHRVTFVSGADGATTNIVTVEDRKNAVRPDVASEAGWSFTGWDKSTDAVTGDMMVKAVYQKLEYPIVYKNLKGVGHSNPLFYDVTREFAMSAPVNRDSRLVFLGWSPTNAIAAGTTGEQVFTARWAYRVDFELDGQLTRTGGGELSQNVPEGGNAVVPEVKVNTGYVFTGWEGSFSNVISAVTIVGGTRRLTFPVVIDGKSKEYGYGDQVTLSVKASATVGGTNIVCRGWTGTGDVPASGAAASVSFTVTQSSTLTWRYGTNYQVRVAATAGGGADLRDAADSSLGNEGWFAAGTNLTAVAAAADGYAFQGWTDGVADAHRAILVDRAVSLTATFVEKPTPGPTPDPPTPVEPVVTNLVVGEWAFTDDVTTISATIPQGVYVQYPVSAAAGTVSVSKLPSGLKYAKKVPTMVYGSPSSAKTYATKFTVKTSSRSKAVYTIIFTVTPLPTALIGSYVGGTTEDPIGSATVTLSKTGRISGKWISSGVTAALSASGFTSYDSERGVYTAVATLKKSTMPLILDFGIDDRGFGVVEAWIDDTAPLFTATLVNWKGAEWKPVAAVLKNRTFTVDYYATEGILLTGKVGVNGVVTVKGQFNVGASKPYKATAKGTLIPMPDDCFDLFLYYPYKKNRFDGYAVRLILQWNGAGFDIIGRK